MTVVLVGSMNMDITVNVPTIPKPGETILGNNLFQSPGGKSSNQAAAVAKAGGEAVLIACIGKDSFGDSLLERAQKMGIDTSLIVRTSDSSSGVALIAVDSRAENSIVVASGANSDLSPDFVRHALAQAENAKVISVTLEIKPETARAALQKARELKIDTVLNLSPVTDQAKELAALADFLVVNENELSQLVGETDSSIESAASHLRAMGCKHVIVTMGSKGALYFQANFDKPEISYFDAISVIAVDTTGCGDAFTGSFAAELAAGRSIPDAIEFGIRAAGYAAKSIGAQSSYGTREEVLEI